MTGKLIMSPIENSGKKYRIPTISDDSTTQLQKYQQKNTQNYKLHNFLLSGVFYAITGTDLSL